MEIRKMEISDILKVMEIEQNSFISPWSVNNFLYELKENPFAHCFVIEIDGEIVGFLDYWITFETCQLNQIAIKEKFKNQGIGSMLLSHLFNQALKEQLDIITLEVRKNNTPAIEFYKKHGFECILVKEKYYQNGDDALYMIKRVGEINGKDYISD